MPRMVSVPDFCFRRRRTLKADAGLSALESSAVRTVSPALRIARLALPEAEEYRSSARAKHIVAGASTACVPEQGQAREREPVGLVALTAQHRSPCR